VTAPDGIADAIGFFASGMTLAAFSCRRMRSLRAAAILANLLFIAYGALLNLLPVLLLHCLLLPLNITRLANCMRNGQGDWAAPKPDDASFQRMR